MSVENKLMWARYRARVRNYGICSVCTLRQETGRIFHCKGNYDRQGGCMIDGELPKFRLDDQLLDSLRSDNQRGEG